MFIQFSSVAQSCLTLCDPMNRSTPGLPVHHQLLEFTQSHVHRVSDAIQPSQLLSSTSPPACNLSLFSPNWAACSLHYVCIVQGSARDLGRVSVQFSSVQSISRVWLFVTPWTTAHQASLSFTISWSLLKFMSIELVMPFNSSAVVPFFSCSQSFPASGSFPMSWLFASGGWSIAASASVLPMNIQGWFPLGLTYLLAVKGLSRIYSSITN